MSKRRVVFVYQDLPGEWRWRLYAGNQSDVLADSGQGYSERNKVARIARSVFAGSGYGLEWSVGDRMHREVIR